MQLTHSKQIVYTLILLLVAGATLNAQKKIGNYAVKGVLVDSLLNESEPYATIRIAKKQAPDKPVKLAVTDERGRFNEKLPEAGFYLIQLSSVGKQTVMREFTLTDHQKEIDLGTLYTAEATEMLKGVEVVAQKPLVKAEIDKISYSIEDDPDSKTNTTLEMLRKVPLVTVDGEDNIQVNGSSNFKVHVNGKPNTLMSNNPKEVLRSLPANSVKSIEVITEPGAKYDAEGIGGILNIITTDARMQGYNVTLGANASNMGVSGYAYGTVQAGKLTLSGNYSYNHQNTPEGKHSSGREDFTSTDFRHLSQHGLSDSKGNFQFGNIEGSYEIDTLNLITFSANLFGGNFKTHNHSFAHMDNSNHEEQYSYLTRNHSKNKFSQVGINFDYQHSFKKKGEYLTLSYKFNGSPDDNESETRYEDESNVPFLLTDQYFDNDAKTNEHTAQVDYVNPINETHYIDAGIKYIYRQNKSDSKYFRENAQGEMEANEDLSSKYKQGQNILAAYADYQLKWKKFGAKAGIRYEHTFMDVAYAYLPYRNFNANFDDVVPSVNLSYMLGTSSTLRANYNMRINRPGIWFLNPFRDTSNPTSVSYGNPDLETEKAHNLGLTFSSFSAKFNLNANLTYMFINNGIEAYSFMNNGILENTYGNVGKSQRTRLSLWMNWNPGSKTRISINAGGSYADFKSHELNTNNHGFTGDFFGNIQQTIPWNLRFSLYGGGSTPQISLQGKGSSYHYYGINLSRSFLKDKRLNISLFASSLFNKYISFKKETVTETFRSWSENQSPSRRYGISISWRFGELKAQVKKASRSIMNDDVKGGGNNNTSAPASN